MCIFCKELKTNRDGKFLDCEHGDLAALGPKSVRMQRCTGSGEHGLNFHLLVLLAGAGCKGCVLSKLLEMQTIF